MSQRALATVIAIPLVAALWIVALVVPLPYVVYSPGVTVNVLGKQKSAEIIQVSGHEAYRDDGQLRMTTVYVTRPDARVNLLELMGAWLSPDEAVYPHDAVYRPEETNEDAEQEGAAQMVTSQDFATVTALREMGYSPKTSVKVMQVQAGMPADGALSVGDVLLRIGDTKLTKPEDAVTAIGKVAEGEKVAIRLKRDGERLTVEVTPKQVDGQPRVGIVPAIGYDFPFTVNVGIDPDIGGPSAGLMFSLGIYDTLTEGSLTDGEIIAGTGTIDAEGKVGPIGGIQQKIVAARDAGAKLFFVPPDNCADVEGAHNDDMRLVRADTMHDAVEALNAWTADSDAELPVCEGS